MSLSNKYNFSKELEQDNNFLNSETFYQAENFLEINCQPKTVLKFVSTIIFCLVSLSTLGQLYFYLISRESFSRLIKLFFLNAEKNIPTFYSALALLFCSVLLAIIAKSKYNKRDKYRGYWKFLSLIFLYLAIDENSSIHEMSGKFTRGLLNTSGFFHYAWVIPGIILFSLFVFIYLKFVLSLPKRTKFLFILAAAIFVLGAIGIEMIGGNFSSLAGRKNLPYAMIATVEETLEMSGIAIFMYALLEYMQKYVGQIKIRW